MNDTDVALHFDFIDPLSYLLELELQALGPDVSSRVRRVGFELRPPPTPLTSLGDPELAARWAAARSVAAGLGGIVLDPPDLVPWSRKAHELHLHAASKDLADAVGMAIYGAYFASGRDIGRVDVLVEIGREVGLDPTETKAVLDVDRYESAVAERRSAASEAGITEPPVVVRGDARLRGFHNRERLGTFLRSS